MLLLLICLFALKFAFVANFLCAKKFVAALAICFWCIAENCSWMHFRAYPHCTQYGLWAYTNMSNTIWTTMIQGFQLIHTVILYFGCVQRKINCNFMLSQLTHNLLIPYDWWEMVRKSRNEMPECDASCFPPRKGVKSVSFLPIIFPCSSQRLPVLFHIYVLHFQGIFGMTCPHSQKVRIHQN